MFKKIQKLLYIKLRDWYARQHDADIKQYHIVSLGWNCLPRSLTTEYGLKPTKRQGEKSLPFDLSIHRLKWISECIKNDFQGYFDGIYKDPDKKFFVNPDKTEYNHDMDMESLEAFKERYVNRIANFREIIKSPKPIIFIYNPQDGNYDSPDDLIELYSILKEKRQTLPFELLVIDKSENRYLHTYLHAHANYIHTCRSRVQKGYVWWKQDDRYTIRGIMFEMRIVTKVYEIIKHLKKQKKF